MQILERLTREAGREYALRNLKSNIISLDLLPGSMVSENEIATLLGVSRTPVREALVELSYVGMVAIYPQKGSAITLIDEALVEQSTFMRIALECTVVEYCCDRATELDIERLREHIKLQEFHLQSKFFLGDPHELDNGFHKLLFDIAKQPLVFDMMRRMAIHMDRLRTLTFDDIPRLAVCEEHAVLVDVIESRDKDRAREMMKTHITRYQSILDKLRGQHKEYFKHP
ncbi:MAG: GntR family transcriptional regulator [Eubacteriales bacterium]